MYFQISWALSNEGVIIVLHFLKTSMCVSVSPNPNHSSTQSLLYTWMLSNEHITTSGALSILANPGMDKTFLESLRPGNSGATFLYHILLLYELGEMIPLTCAVNGATKLSTSISENSLLSILTLSFIELAR